jgi:hypothetical protein
MNSSAVLEVLAAQKSFPLVFMPPEGLDKIMEEDDVRCVQGRRKAASKAVAQQRKMLSEGSGGDSADDSEPGSSTSKLYPASKLIIQEFSKSFWRQFCMQSTGLNL